MSSLFAMPMIAAIIVSWFWELIYFPFWWYTEGFLQLSRALFGYLGDEFTGLGIAVWSRNLFIPMYGQRDIGSRLISFFMRLVQIIFRFLYWLLLSCLVFLLIIIWLAAPILAISELIWQIT